MATQPARTNVPRRLAPILAPGSFRAVKRAGFVFPHKATGADAVPRIRFVFPHKATGAVRPVRTGFVFPHKATDVVSRARTAVRRARTGSSFRTRPQMKERSANLLKMYGFVRKDAG